MKVHYGALADFGEITTSYHMNMYHQLPHEYVHICTIFGMHYMTSPVNHSDDAHFFRHVGHFAAESCDDSGIPVPLGAVFSTAGFFGCLHEARPRHMCPSVDLTIPLGEP